MHEIFKKKYKEIKIRIFYLLSGNIKILFNWKLESIYFNKRYFKNIYFDNKTVLFIFAGRKDRMSISMKYVNDLIKNRSIDFVHIWNFSRNKSDFQWIKTLDKKYPQVKVFSPSFFGKYTKFSYRQYKIAYEFYSMQIFNNTNFIKLDDDMLYLDTDKKLFQKFIDFIALTDSHASSHYMVSSNVVNNGVCAYFQQKKYDLIPSDLDNFYFPCENEKPGLAMSEYWDSGSKSEKLHYYFLKNRNRFIQKARMIDTDTETIELGTRFSINFIGFKQIVITSFIKDNCIDDEEYFSTIFSKKINKHIKIFLPLVSSHLSYFTQKQQDDLSLIKEYLLLKD